MSPSPHNHQHCISQALAQAIRLCEAKGARFTAARQRVLELIWQTHEPVKAYDILEILQQEDPSAKPPTVYRALEFLMEHGLVHKLESLNAYVGCIHPQKNHQCYFFLCTKCSGIEEFCSDALSTLITVHAQQHGFHMVKQTVEVQGLCKQCHS